MCVYIPSFLDVLPIEVTTGHRVEFPELYSRFSLVTILMLYQYLFMHSINSIYMLIPVSQIIHPPFPSWCPYGVALYLCVSIFVLLIRSSFYHYIKFHLLKYLIGSLGTHRAYQQGSRMKFEFTR